MVAKPRSPTPVDLNTASKDTLVKFLPYVTDAIALAIIEARPFRNWNDVSKKVRGIGKAKVKKLRYARAIVKCVDKSSSSVPHPPSSPVLSHDAIDHSAIPSGSVLIARDGKGNLAIHFSSRLPRSDAGEPLPPNYTRVPVPRCAPSPPLLDPEEAEAERQKMRDRYDKHVAELGLEPVDWNEKCSKPF